nr:MULTISPECIES: POTRA domain-containing protein [Myxococcaceae]
MHLPAGVDTAGLSELVAVRAGQHLSTRAVRRSIERLWATGRFTDVVARVQEGGAGAGVTVVFELTPVKQLAELGIVGNVVLRDEQVRAASGLAEGRPFDPDGLDAALRAIQDAYHARGYDSAQVQVERREVPGGVSLTLVVDEGPPTRVAAVTLAGSPGLPLPELLGALGLQVGGVLERAALADGVERLRTRLREQRFYRARVDEPQVKVEGTRASISVPVQAGPQVSFHFHGNHHFTDATLRDVLAYDASEPLDAVIIGRLSRRLAAFYRHRGYHSVRVEPREVPRPDGAELVLVFEVEEGPPLVVREVRFEGNTAFDDETLRQALFERVRVSAPDTGNAPRLMDDPLAIEGRERREQLRDANAPDPSTVFVEGPYLEAADLMTAAYRERGYLQAQVRFAELVREEDTRTARARFVVHEGPQARVASLTREGFPVGGAPLPGSLAPGSVFGFPAVERDRLALGHALGRRGYLFAKVEAQTDVSADGREARVRFRAEPGPQVRVGQIILQGLGRTEESTVRANLKVRAGDVLDPEALFETQRALVLLGIFRQVTVRLLAPETVEPTKDVVVEVRERPRIDGEVAGGYFLVDGPRVQLDTAFPNVNGSGLNLNARGKLNYVGWNAQVLSGEFDCPRECEELTGLPGLGGQGTLSVAQPRLYALLPLEVGARLDVIGERVHRASYVSTRAAAVASLDWAATRWLSLSLQYQLENSRVRPLGVAGTELVSSGRPEEERTRFDYGVFGLHSLRPTATLDFRNDPVNPRRGLLLSTSAELIRGLSVAPTDAQGNPLPAFPINGLKLSGTFSVYVPAGKRAVLAASLRGGTVRQLESGARTIPPKRFFLGGSTSLRGFREDNLLPEDRRRSLHTQLADCRALLNPAGCSQEALVLLGGDSLPSQGGELFTLAKLELRVPVYRALDVGLFTEAGNLWLDPAAFDLAILRPVAGAGLRYSTPVGPLALDVGVNLHRDREVNEPSMQVHFAIGLF